ncbi:hypothetical protein AcV7_006253 [Taiwanofungus camphoratus]|nr:hypothetical protein AcV7_006253 [Antrodia cinnamomea]
MTGTSQYPSTPSLLSVSTATSSDSTSPLTSTASPCQRKDYASAFGALQSKLGMFGGAPVPVSSVTKPKQSRKPARNDASLHQQPCSAGPKNYEAAFGNLASSYGFGHSVSSKKKPL